VRESVDRPPVLVPILPSFLYVLYLFLSLGKVGCLLFNTFFAVKNFCPSF
jgi:hypothetical protein